MCSDKTGKDRSIGDPAAKPSIFQVFIAKYKYDPVQFSPNENPEAELNLNAGDYIFVYGDVDEVCDEFSCHFILVRQPNC